MLAIFCFEVIHRYHQLWGSGHLSLGTQSKTKVVKL